MKRPFLFILPLWLGALVYIILSLFNGPNGFSAYRQMQQEIDIQKENLSHLQNLNVLLVGDMDALLYDQDAIAARARELGYGKLDENFIRIVGVPGSLQKTFNEGRVLKAAIPEFMPNERIRYIAFGAAAALFLSILIAELLRRQDEPANNGYRRPGAFFSRFGAGHPFRRP
ncbi:MAG: septum formation initiator family protein [Spirochaetaceae bacterium]|jgi:cell division protein FtsB|nr:septum formation initiator family protein [Spirochaetaceae bacterium]